MQQKPCMPIYLLRQDAAKIGDTIPMHSIRPILLHQRLHKTFGCSLWFVAKQEIFFRSVTSFWKDAANEALLRRSIPNLNQLQSHASNYTASTRPFCFSSCPNTIYQDIPSSDRSMASQLPVSTTGWIGFLDIQQTFVGFQEPFSSRMFSRETNDTAVT